jgi:protein-tyrosine phosphatase
MSDVISFAGFTDFVTVPRFSQIEEKLWMGGTPRGLADQTLPVQFDFAVNLHPWEPYSTHAHQAVLMAWMQDAPVIPDIKLIEHAADIVNQSIARGATVLVHCQAGLNRSGLVTALALMKAGRSAEDAIGLLRSKRCAEVLCNKTFFEWLMAR